MSSQQTLAGKGKSNTNKRFKYVLSDKYSSKVLRFAPDGWKDSELTFIRDKFYKGVIESFSTNELTFVKDGRDFIQSGYERENEGGIDYEINIHIYILNNSTFKYQLYFSGKLDLSTYKIDSIGVTCEVIPSGFQNVVLNRDDIEVDMMSDKFIGGGSGSMEYLSTVWEKVMLPAYIATQNADWTIFQYPDNYYSRIWRHYLPMQNIFTEYEEAAISGQIYQSTDDGSQQFFEANEDLNVKLSGKISIIISSDVSNNFSFSIEIQKNGVGLFGYSNSEAGVNSAEFTYNIPITDITLVSGDKLSLIGVVSGINSDEYTIQYLNSSLSVYRQLGETLENSYPAMFYIYEAFARTLQLISGQSLPIYSEILGRTDSAPESYPVDGEASLIAITNGRWLRGFSPNTNQLNFSLKDLFKTINSVFNIGLGFEKIDNLNKVRIEHETYFFDIIENTDYLTDGKYWIVNQILDLSSWLNNEMISKEVLPDWYANEISGGYSKFEYENIQGLKEFNTETKWAIPVKSVKSILDVKSEYRADTQGVNKLRFKPFDTFPTEDVNGDNDIFIFDVKRGGPYVFTVKTNEDFANVSGGVDPAQSYNLNFTPRRNLERHGSRLRSMQLQLGSEIQWLKSDKNTKLVTRKTGETTDKAENGDIMISTLTPGYWIPEAYIFQSPVDENTIAAIQANPRGVIKIAADKYGWILEVQTNNEDKKGEFKLLRMDLRNVKINSGD
jgi:hypothetical protein